MFSTRKWTAKIQFILIFQHYCKKNFIGFSPKVFLLIAVQNYYKIRLIIIFVMKMFTMISISPKLKAEVLSWGLAIIAFALPLSVFLISVGQFIILLNWLTERNWNLKWNRILQSPSLWLIMLFYGVHLAWLINTSDFVYALHDLKIKLPFLVIPLIIGTSDVLSSKQVRKIIIAFCAGVFLSSLYSTFKIYTISGDPIALGREISPFVSHIRLALMVNFAVFSLIWLFHTEAVLKFRFIYIFWAGWFSFFLIILQSLTGIVVFVAVVCIYIGIIVFKSKSLMVKWFSAILLVLLILLPSTYLIHMYSSNFSPLPVYSASLDKNTVNGNPYMHNTKPEYVENGNYIYIYICETELKREWEKRSSLNYDSLDKAGHPVKYTLFRYLTALGLRKDSAGLTHLNKEDIIHIENSIANPVYVEKSGIKPRFYRAMWELYHYRLGADPSGYSVAQRIEYLKTAIHIIRNNFWFGTGTGDVVKAFQDQYEQDNSPLSPRWRLRAHNQLVTFFLSFGIIGFLIVMISLFVPPFLRKRFNDYLFLSFFFIFVLSMLNEDTLETHAGISFIALFYALLLLSENNYKPLIVGKENIKIG